MVSLRISEGLPYIRRYLLCQHLDLLRESSTITLSFDCSSPLHLVFPLPFLSVLYNSYCAFFFPFLRLLFNQIIMLCKVCHRSSSAKLVVVCFFLDYLNCRCWEAEGAHAFASSHKFVLVFYPILYIFFFGYLSVLLLFSKAETNMNWNWTLKDFGRSSVHLARKRYFPCIFYSTSANGLFCIFFTHVFSVLGNEQKLVQFLASSWF